MPVPLVDVPIYNKLCFPKDEADLRGSTVSVVSVRRRFRLRLWLIREARWLVPALRCFTFPLAVRRKRFFVPLWVFILGMIGYHFPWLGGI